MSRRHRGYPESVGVAAQYVIPVSSREGDNIVAHRRTCLVHGADIVEALDRFHGAPREFDLPLRLPVQDIYKFDSRRIIAGRIEVGPPRGRRHAAVLAVQQIGANRLDRDMERPGTGLGGRRPVHRDHAERADFRRARRDREPHREGAGLTDVFRARVFWLGDKPLSVGQRYLMKYNTAEIPVEIQKIERAIDTTDLIDKPTDSVARDMVADIVLRARRLVALDDQKANMARRPLRADAAISPSSAAAPSA